MEEDTENRALSTPMRKRKATPRGSSTAKKRHKNAEMEDTSSMDSLDSDSLATPRSVSKKRKATPRGSSTAKKRHKNAEMEDTPRTEDVSMAGFDKKFASVNGTYDKRDKLVRSAKKNHNDAVLHKRDMERSAKKAEKLFNKKKKFRRNAQTVWLQLKDELAGIKTERARMEERHASELNELDDREAKKQAKLEEAKNGMNTTFEAEREDMEVVLTELDEATRRLQTYDETVSDQESSFAELSNKFRDMTGEQIFAMLHLPHDYGLIHNKNFTLARLYNLQNLLKKCGFPPMKNVIIRNREGYGLHERWEDLCPLVNIKMPQASHDRDEQLRSLLDQIESTPKKDPFETSDEEDFEEEDFDEPDDDDDVDEADETGN